MTKRIIIFGKFLTILALTSHIDIYSMEITNKNLLSLPNEIICFILAHSIDSTQSLKNTINSCLQLSTVCKRFNMTQLFITIGTACSHHNAIEKNTLMKNLLDSMRDVNYNNKRNGAFLLTYAGADNAAGCFSLLHEATHYNDTQMVTALFDNNANPNQHDPLLYPTFFYSNTIEMAQLFIDKAINLNKEFDDYFCPNIIWACIAFNRSPELIEFYLNRDVNAKQLNTNGGSILHSLARGDYCHKHGTKDNIKVATLILKKAPDMINLLYTENKSKEYERELTPLDISQEIIKRYGKTTPNYTTLIAFIGLFKEYGGKTAQQLFIDKKT